MNKDKLMQFLSEAIDNGASLSVHLPQYNENWEPVTKDESLRFAAMFQDAVGGEITECETTDESVCESFTVKAERFRGDFSHNPRRYMKEDVDLSGMEDKEYA